MYGLDIGLTAHAEVIWGASNFTDATHIVCRLCNTLHSVMWLL